MPEVSRFFGIVVSMFYNDHAPPHFHARYGGEQASIRIDNGEILDGKLSVRALRLVNEWRVLEQGRLLRNWTRAREKAPLERIEGLDQDHDSGSR